MSTALSVTSTTNLLFSSFYRPQNIIAQSQSGTGKTAAFVLGMLSRTDTSKNYPHVVCMSPTLELAIQTGDVARSMAKYCPGIRIRIAVQGEQRKFIRLLDQIYLNHISCLIVVI